MIDKDRLAWLYELRGKQIKLGLEPTRKLLSRIGLLPLPFPVIHIAGTNGKGSVAAFIHALLSAHGLKTGLYTSPHISRFNERVRMGKDLIPDDFINQFLDDREAVIIKLETTFFETTTAMAFAWLARQDIDVAVVETGLGGRFDATNVVDPVATVITSIDYDHQQFLGDTLKEIAAEKLGIVKKGRPLFTLPQDPELFDLFSDITLKNEAPLFRIEALDITVDNRGTSFKLNSREWRISLPGVHQAYNAALALAVVEFHLQDQFNPAIASEALEETRWPGRIEIWSRQPLIILDSAHNAAGMTVLFKTIEKIWPDRKWTGVMALMADKDMIRIFPLLNDQFEHLFCTSFSYHRALEAKDLVNKLANNNIPAEILTTDGFEKIFSGLDEQNGLVVFGSHYILDETVLKLGRIKKKALKGLTKVN